MAQLVIRPPVSSTLTNTCACGFAQSTAVTAPRSVNGFVLSNFAAIAWCAASGATPSRIAAQLPSHCWRARVMSDAYTSG